MNPFRPRPFFPVVAITALLASGHASAGAEESAKDGGAAKPETAKKRVWEKAERERFHAWESLSPEQRERLREALRQVWTDPSVITAREEIKHASDAYQAAIKSALEKTDPSVAELLAKVQMPGGMGAGVPGGLGAMNLPGGPAVPGTGPVRNFDEQIRPPGFLESLSPEDREKFRRAEAAALGSEAVKAARAELAKIREEDEALRRKRLEAHRHLRKVTVGEMVRIDPSITPMQKRLLEAGKPGPTEKKKSGEGKEEKSAVPSAEKKKQEKETE
ncbi:MAG: hypothetical protein KGR69_05545 [Verrucomicrobia bacterium]|nr:hypothetical protein [Verrucomicrobiota bacterium]